MFTDFHLVIDSTFTIGDDVEGDAEIARSKDLIAVTIPRTPEPSFGILPVIDESPNLLLDCSNASWEGLIDMSAHTALDVGSPIAFEVHSSKTGDHRIQSGPLIFASCWNLRQDQAFHRVSKIPDGVDLRIQAKCILRPLFAGMKFLERPHRRVQPLDLPPIAGAPSPISSRLLIGETLILAF